MTTYLIRRLIAMIPVLFVVAVVSFTIIHLAPGDPVLMILGDDATQQDIQNVRSQLGLDRPLYVQFFVFVSQLVRGDLGTSLFFSAPVSQAILERAEPTIMLTLLSLAISLTLGVLMGVTAAVKRNSAVDQTILVFSLFGVAMPNFWLGLNLILLFSVVLGWLPTSGYVPLREGGLGGVFRSLILPATALGFSQAALISRMTRSSVLDVLSQDFIRTARAKGVLPRMVLYRHALRNALIPVLTVAGISMATLIGGSVVIETVFAIPGVGSLMVQSIFRRDYPVIQGTLVVVAGLYVLVNLLVDMAYVVLDPRISYT
jgi:peptide/nickel transport system permease protein